MLRAIVEYFCPPPIEGRAAFGRFVSGEASYLAQRSTYEFARNTLAWFGQGAFRDDRFNEIFRVSRWESFAAILADMIVVAEGQLRPEAGNAEEILAARLAALYAELLAEYPLPVHRARGWDEMVEHLNTRLSLGRSAAPFAAGEVARNSARRVFDTLPVYSEHRDKDYEVIENAVRFGVIAFSDRLRRRLRPGPVAAELLAGAP